METYYDFNTEKNSLLKKERGICFEEIIAAIQSGSLVDTIEHPNQEQYEGQRIYIINIDNYIYLVPFVENKNSVFLKTIFPSRKLTKQYLGDEK